MQYSRHLPSHHYSPRNFDQEREDLQQGHREYVQSSQEMVDWVMANEEYSAAEKKELLSYCREDLVEKETEYQQNMQQLEQEETAYYGTEEGTHQMEDTDYCDLPEQQPQQDTAADYCDVPEQTTQSPAQEQEQDYGM